MKKLLMIAVFCALMLLCGCVVENNDTQKSESAEYTEPDEGYDAGYEDGLEEGFSRGQDPDYNSDCYSEWHGEGYDDGYKDGYYAALNGIEFGDGYDTYEGVDYYDEHPYDWDAYYGDEDVLGPGN